MTTTASSCPDDRPVAAPTATFLRWPANLVLAGAVVLVVPTLMLPASVDAWSVVAGLVVFAVCGAVLWRVLGCRTVVSTAGLGVRRVQSDRCFPWSAISATATDRGLRPTRVSVVSSGPDDVASFSLAGRRRAGRFNAAVARATADAVPGPVLRPRWIERHPEAAKAIGAGAFLLYVGALVCSSATEYQRVLGTGVTTLGATRIDPDGVRLQLWFGLAVVGAGVLLLAVGSWFGVWLDSASSPPDRREAGAAVTAANPLTVGYAKEGPYWFPEPWGPSPDVRLGLLGPEIRPTVAYRRGRFEVQRAGTDEAIPIGTISRIDVECVHRVVAGTRALLDGPGGWAPVSIESSRVTFHCATGAVVLEVRAPDWLVRDRLGFSELVTPAPDPDSAPPSRAPHGDAGARSSALPVGSTEVR